MSKSARPAGAASFFDGTLQEKRGRIAVIALVIAFAFVAGGSLGLPKRAADILFDRHGALWPFSVQTFMWFGFALAMGELLIRLDTGIADERELAKSYLPEDPRTILTVDQLPAIFRRVTAEANANRRFLPRLIGRCSLQFQTNRSLSQTTVLLNSSAEMFSHEVDLRYNMLRYIAWMIPTLGFIGTVIGIGLALEFAGEPESAGRSDMLTIVTGMLAVSFNGTLVALLLATIIVFFMHICQAKEEHALNMAVQYCLDHLVNRLYVPEGDAEPVEPVKRPAR